jgi:hypothetical protein
MTRLFIIGSAIGLTLASSVAFAGGHIRDHRNGGSRFGDPPGGIRTYHGYHRPPPGYRDPHISPAPAGGYGSGSTIRDHRSSNVRDHRSHHPHYGGTGGTPTVRDHRSPGGYGDATVRVHRGLKSPLVKGPFF